MCLWWVKVLGGGGGGRRGEGRVGLCVQVLEFFKRKIL